MNKVIVITGASRGIGAATARLAAAHGYAVCVNYLKSQKDADSIVDEIKSTGGKALAVAADISLETDVVNLFKTVDTRLGVLTALVNNAVRRMSRKHGGSGGVIVNVSSAASRLGSAGEYVDYAASKGAIDTLTIGLSREVAAEGIRVNAVRPAFIYTDIHASGGEPDRVDRIKAAIPMKRGGRPEEVANAIMWLLSDEASYVTGTFLDLAGGK